MTGGGGASGLSGCGGGEADFDAGALVVLKGGVDPHAAVEGFGDVVGFGEAEAPAAGGAVFDVAGAVAEADDMGDFAGGDAAAGVGDDEAEEVVVVGESGGDGAAGGGVFAGVGDEVAHDVLEDGGHEDVSGAVAADVEVDEVVAVLVLGEVVDDAVGAAAVLFDGLEEGEEVFFEGVDAVAGPGGGVGLAFEEFAGADLEDEEDAVEVGGDGIKQVVVVEGGVFAAEGAEVLFAVEDEGLDIGDEVCGGIGIAEVLSGVGDEFEEGGEVVGVAEAVLEAEEFVLDDGEDVEHAVHVEEGDFVGGEGGVELNFHEGRGGVGDD